MHELTEAIYEEPEPHQTGGTELQPTELLDAAGDTPNPPTEPLETAPPAQLPHEFGVAWVGGAASPADIAALRMDLAPLTVAAVTETLGEVASDALMREQPVPALRKTAGRNDFISLMVRLFTLGREVAVSDIEPHLPNIGIAGLERLGIIERSSHDNEQPHEQPNETVKALVDLRPYAAEIAVETAPSTAPEVATPAAPEADSDPDSETATTEPLPIESRTVNWWIVSDLSELALGGPLSPNHVLGVGGATTTLAAATVRRPVQRALDLGTGCGLQAMHAAQHAQHVIATDISWRALDMARFNAQLNDMEIEFRFGSMLEPVRDETFDLIVSNPPFVITPRNPNVPEYTYRDGGRSGDAIVAELVQAVSQHLNPGGIAQFLGNWEQRGEQTWQERLQTWFTNPDEFAWVIQREFQDPAEYAETWIRDGGTYVGHPDYEALLAVWLDDLDSRSVTGIGFGMVTIVRHPESHIADAAHAEAGSSDGARPAEIGQPNLRIEERPEALRQALGPHLDECLTAREWLAQYDDATILQSHLVRATDVTEERHYTPGFSDPSVIIIRQGRGFARQLHADTVLAGLVGACDGELTVQQIIGGISVIFDLNIAELEVNLMPTIRDLIMDGFLLVGESLGASDETSSS